MNRRFPLATFAVLLLALAACGDDGDAAPNDSGAASDVGTDAGGDAIEQDTDDDASDLGDSSDADEDATPSGPTLDELHATVLSGCGGPLCHLNGQSQGGLNLDNDEGLMDRLLADSTVEGVKVVFPGDEMQSFLYLKCTDDFRALVNSGSRMPLGSRPLGEPQLELIAEWIRSLE